MTSLVRRKFITQRSLNTYPPSPPALAERPLPPGIVRGESRTLMPASSFKVLLVNARSLVRNGPHLFAHLKLEQPSLLAICETWLDSSVGSFEIPGYTLVSRFDRLNAQGGGIAVYASIGFPCVSHLASSVCAERSWHLVHTNLGSFLFGLWYRPPNEDPHLINHLAEEIAAHQEGTLGTILCGDLNVHHANWLTHSSGISVAGRTMYEVCSNLGLKQMVQNPTRANYLLDLVLTDMPELVNCTIVDGVADHRNVLFTVCLPPVTCSPIARTVWLFKFANWNAMRSRLLKEKWNTMPHDVDEACVWLNSILSNLLKQYVPSKQIVETKASHPWINSACIRAVREKRLTPNCPFAIATCANILQVEYKRWVERTKASLQHMPARSKQWWNIMNALMHRARPCCSMPPLWSDTWVYDPETKAGVLAMHFASHQNAFPNIVPARYADEGHVVAVRSRIFKRLLLGLDKDKSTGPDNIPAIFLQQCARELCLPVSYLARRILVSGKWPQKWKHHRIVPILKRSPAHVVENYRGIHITPVLSKVVETFCAFHLDNVWLEHCAFGDYQWACTKERGVQELLAIMVCSWLLALMKNEKVALFISDIRGAFDNVCSARLLGKLSHSGISGQWLNLMSSWLSSRTASVVVNGACSAPVGLSNSIFQGTSLGPRLWNIFCADLVPHVLRHHFVPLMFADDISCFKCFPAHAHDDQMQNEVAHVSEDMHTWGAENIVAFDPSKERTLVLHLAPHELHTFKLLGVVFDTKLQMSNAIEDLVSRARARLKCIMRVSKFQPLSEQVYLFKCHVLPIIEWCCCTYFHATDTLLRKVDGVLGSFAYDLGISRRDLFLRHGLMHTRLRRDIAMLGLLYKCAVGNAHRMLQELFPRVTAHTSHNSRLQNGKHNLQLQERLFLPHNLLCRRSLYGLVRIFNVLPPSVVHVAHVTHFQTNLTRMAKRACEDDMEDWFRLFSPTNTRSELELARLFRIIAA